MEVTGHMTKITSMIKLGIYIHWGECDKLSDGCYRRLLKLMESTKEMEA